MTFDSFLTHLGLQKNHHILIHTAFRAVRSVFPDLAIDNLIKHLQERVTPNGSIIMPAFTDRKIIQPFLKEKLTGYYFLVRIIYEAGIQYLHKHFQNLLCRAGACQACDARRQFYLERMV